jgi:hypothetical protein
VRPKMRVLALPVVLAVAAVPLAGQVAQAAPRADAVRGVAEKSRDTGSVVKIRTPRASAAVHFARTPNSRTWT